MHTEKQKIFDDYAKEQGFTDMMHFVSSSLLDSAQLCNHIFEVCDIVQKAQQDRIAKAANVRHTIIVLGEKFPETTRSCGNDEEIFTVDQESITSENNLIK